MRPSARGTLKNKAVGPIDLADIVVAPEAYLTSALLGMRTEGEPFILSA
jgi:hypothetical protein